MGNIHVISGEDLGGISQKALLICADRSIKEMRQSSITLANTFSHAEFSREIKTRVRKAGHYLSGTDCRYILLKLIEQRYADDPQTLQIFKDIRHPLFELYSFLAFAEATVAEEALQKISEDYSGFERDIFALYNQFSQRVDDACAEYDIDTYQHKMKHTLRGIAREYPAIILDGFLFFSDEYKFLVRAALEEDADVYLTVKTNSQRSVEPASV